MLDYVVVHNTKSKRFEVEIDGKTALLEYRDIQPNLWSLPHTFVPPQLAGKGIASELVKTALEYCKENNIQVIPVCSFVVQYIRRHPEWESLVRE